MKNNLLNNIHTSTCSTLTYTFTVTVPITITIVVSIDIIFMFWPINTPTCSYLLIIKIVFVFLWPSLSLTHIVIHRTVSEAIAVSVIAADSVFALFYGVPRELTLVGLMPELHTLGYAYES